MKPLVVKAVIELADLGKRYTTVDQTLELELEDAFAARKRAEGQRARVEHEKTLALEEAAAKLQDARDRLDGARRRHESALEELRKASMVDVSAAEKLHAEAVASRKATESSLRAADQELAGVKAQLEQLREKEQTLKCLRAEVGAAEEAVGDWSLLAQALGRDGIQALEIDAAGPEIARLTNELLEACYGSRFSISFETLREKKSARGEYTEAFDVRVYDQGRPRPVEALSGGERVVVGEAIGLAFSILNARKSGIRWETLFRDETAGALDPENAQAYVEMLRRALALGGFHQVVFVSHQAEVHERADVSLVIEDGRIERGR